VTYEEIVGVMNNDPVVQRLLRAPIPARLAYVRKDGSPSVVPVSYLWNGEAFVFASPPDWPKIEAIGANPKVALTVDTTGLPPDHPAGTRGSPPSSSTWGCRMSTSRHRGGSSARIALAEWEAAVRAEERNMALVSITPTWIKVIDFETRFPGPGQPSTKG
jgi:hypothetical protein